MKCLIVDDESSARQYLADLLEDIEGADVIGEAKDGVEAVEKINRLRPDLVFLDIQMPLMDGLSLIPYLIHKPMIAFVTAFDQFAVQAFEAHAIDYLLKPVESDRLKRAVSKAKHEWQKLVALHEKTSRDKQLSHVICRQGQKSLLIKVEDIRIIHKEGRYSAIETKQGQKLLTELTLDYFENHSSSTLFRINRACIVHLDAITEFDVQNKGIGTLMIDGSTAQSISRSRLPRFKKWISEKHHG